MMKFNDFVLIMGIGWFVMGSLDLITNNNENKQSRKYALITLFMFLFVFMDHLIKPNLGINPMLQFPFRTAYFLIGPALYFYSLTLVEHKKISLLVLLLHCIPFLIMLGVQYMDHLFFHNFKPPVNPQKGVMFDNSRVVGFGLVLLLSNTIHICIYMCLIQYKIHKHNSKILDFYSYKSFSNSLTWLRIITLLAIPYYFVIFISAVQPYLGQETFIPFAKKKLPVLPVVFMFLFTYFSRNQQIPEDIQLDREDKGELEDQKYKKSSISNSEKSSIYNKLKEVMEEQKLYIDPEITMEKLAQIINVSRHNISQVINSETNDNFYTFINRYRVEEFKRVLVEDKFPNFSLIGIALECGFRSSSAFYRVFKNIEGITLSAFKKSIEVKSISA